ncbi:MAG: hypothetical protein RLZZ427_1053 [Pseudomonadota bacterium]|jgi:hypothetical protein
MIVRPALLAALAGLAGSLLAAAPVLARDTASPSREGRIDVARFRAADAAADGLGKGVIAVAAMPAAIAPEREQATYEAAVVDQLAKAGYDVATTDPAGGQVAELRLAHSVVEPAEPPHKPVSGAMTMGVSNHGSMLGMAIAVDLTKPARALVSTRLELRIKDRRSAAVLWEGRAEIVTREGDARWSDQAIAARLAAVLFDGFPNNTAEVSVTR